jgi:hypothetical protein
LCSCNQRDGDCVPIELGIVFFNSQEGIDSTFIYDEGYNWWFSESQYPNQYSREKCNLIEPKKIECSWFSMEKRDSFVIVSVEQNYTNQKRDVSIKVPMNNGGAGECNENRGWLSVIQCPPYDSIKPSKDELSFSAEGGVESVVIDNIRFRPYLLLSGSGISEYDSPHIYIEEGSLLAESWFTISVSDEKTVVFSVNRNETGKERNLVATIVDTDSDCGSSSNVKIIQSAD